MLEKYWKWRLELRLRRENTLHGEWLEAKEKADNMRKHNSARFNTEASRETKEYMQANIDLHKAQTRATRARLAYNDYKKRSEAWLNKRAVAATRRSAAWNAIKEKWRSLWRGLRATVVETRAEIRRRADSVPGEGVYRRIRRVREYATGYTALGLSLLVNSVSGVLGATFGTVAISGSWSLQRISEALPRLWSGLWDVLTWTVHWVLNVALLLVAGLIEIILTAVSWLVILLAAPFVYTSRALARRSKVESSPVPESGGRVKTPKQKQGVPPQPVSV